MVARIVASLTERGVAVEVIVEGGERAKIAEPVGKHLLSIAQVGCEPK